MIDWHKYFDHIYCIHSNDSNIENAMELNNIGILNSNIFSFHYYTLDRQFIYYKYFKDIAVIEVIKDAYINNYENILILRDDLKFTTINLEKTLNELSDYLYVVLNKDDACEDALILRKPLIDYIANITLHNNSNISNYFDEDKENDIANYYSITNWNKFIKEKIEQNFKTYKVNICRHKIDYVISYVNSTDKTWQEEYNKYNTNTKESFNGTNRWRDWGTLEYNIALLNDNLEWINNIYILVSNETQVPSWVNKYNKVKIICHKDFIPNNVLPTFNSCVIESYLYNIPNISEYFIYSNDDVFCVGKLTINDFFKNGKLRTNVVNIGEITTNHLQICKNSFKLLLTDFNNDYFSEINLDRHFKRLTHIPHPMLKSTGLHIYNMYKLDILKCSTRFRSNTNINQYTITLYDYLQDNVELYKVPAIYCEIGNTTKYDVLINNKTAKFICLNDAKLQYENEDEISNLLIKYLSSKVDLKKQKIDFVFPYVTSDDSNWQKLYKNYLKLYKGDESSWASGIERFRDNGLLKYVLRSIETNMPWVNKVHMIVMDENQIPTWINRNNVNFIFHKDFIPSEYMPVFNASTLEMFLPNLPVAENFVYSNDDLLCFKKINPEYFFKDSIPSYYLWIREYKESAPGDKVRRNSYLTLTDNTEDNKVITTQHGPVPYRLSWIKECYNKYYNKLTESISVFREDKNINQYVYSFYQAKNKEIINNKKNIKDNTVTSEKIDKIMQLNFTNYDFVCLNDNCSMTDESWSIIIDKINSIFPNKSKYEI